MRGTSCFRPCCNLTAVLVAHAGAGGAARPAVCVQAVRQWHAPLPRQAPPVHRDGGACDSVVLCCVLPPCLHIAAPATCADGRRWTRAARGQHACRAAQGARAEALLGGDDICGALSCHSMAGDRRHCRKACCHSAFSAAHAPAHAAGVLRCRLACRCWTRCRLCTRAGALRVLWPRAPFMTASR